MTANVRQKAREFLRVTLGDGPKPAPYVKGLWGLEGYSQRTLWTATRDLGVIVSGGRESTWALPDASQKCEPPASHLCEVEPFWQPLEPVAKVLMDVFGPANLDVCRPSKPMHVKAKRWLGDDGLCRPWTIEEDTWAWINPPPKEEVVRRYLTKLRTEKPPRWIAYLPELGGNTFGPYQEIWEDGNVAIFELLLSEFRWDLLFFHGFNGAQTQAVYSALCRLPFGCALADF